MLCFIWHFCFFAPFHLSGSKPLWEKEFMQLVDRHTQPGKLISLVALSTQVVLLTCEQRYSTSVMLQSPFFQRRVLRK
ncbi:hypothetical protein BKA66DRAFT_474309 [Pyrenochaeta sp. MPI-SDFR-AT-0127]|nr:hypothetical protein BKA66DRAFT_474309 [Pyrenochaeta sp. MPI-SDFR-AT-0127]